MGHLGPVQARYDVLPVPALTADDVAGADHQPAETPPAQRRPARAPAEEPSNAPAPTPRD